MRIGVIGTGLAVVLAGGAALAQGNPYGDPVQMFTTAGYTVSKGDDGKFRALNSCGLPTDPHVALMDMNGDGRQDEAVVMDRDACHTPDGVAFTIIARDAAGQPWRKLFTHAGTLTALNSRTKDGWYDLQYASGGQKVTLHHQGKLYVAEGGAPAPVPVPVAGGAEGAPAPAPAPAPGAPPPAGGGATIAGLPIPAKVAQLKPVQVDALMKAAGYKKVGKGWKGCGGDSDAAIDDDYSPSGQGGGAIQDINGDGRAEVIIVDYSTACYGNTGQGFNIVGQNAQGQWTSLFQSPGIPTVQTTRANGWAEVEVGGPGYCFAVYQWDGRNYEIAYYNEYMQGICATNGLSPARRKY